MSGALGPEVYRHLQLLDPAGQDSDKGVVSRVDEHDELGAEGLSEWLPQVDSVYNSLVLCEHEWEMQSHYNYNEKGTCLDIGCFCSKTDSQAAK